MSVPWVCSRCDYTFAKFTDYEAHMENCCMSHHAPDAPQSCKCYSCAARRRDDAGPGVLEELAGPFGRTEGTFRLDAALPPVVDPPAPRKPGDPKWAVASDAELQRREAASRKATPVASGVLAYFPDALEEVARVSKTGNDQHNPGEPLHWAKDKSTDEADALTRHLLDRLRGQEFDTDGARHLAKVAWRALALLQRELDAAK